MRFRLRRAEASVLLSVLLGCGRVGYDRAAGRGTADASSSSQGVLDAGGPGQDGGHSIDGIVALDGGSPFDATMAREGGTSVDASPIEDAQASRDGRPSASDTAADVSPPRDTPGASDAPLGGEALVGFWTFDDGAEARASDLSRHANHGELIQVAASDWQSGRVAGALSFHVPAFVRVPHDPSLDSVAANQRFTMAAWIRPRVIGGGRGTVMSQQRASTRFEHLSLSLRAGHPLVLFETGTTAETSCEAAAPLEAETWRHLAATFDGADVALFLDGIEVCRTAAKGRLAPSPNDLLIGANGDGTVVIEIFDGLIDEAALFARALTTAELALLVAGARPAP